MCVLLLRIEPSADCTAASLPQQTRNVDDADVVSVDKEECDVTDIATSTAPVPDSVTRCERKPSCAVTCSTSQQQNSAGNDVIGHARGSRCSEEYNGDRSTNSASVSDSGLEFEGNAFSTETSTSDATGHSKDHVSSIPASNMERDVDACLDNASVPDSALQYDGATYGVQMSQLCADATTREFGIGDRAACMSREVNGYNTEEVSTAAAKLVVRSSDHVEVRCIQCNKVLPPQRCPVCKLVFASLPSHIATHSGRNPYTIASLLGLKMPYDNGDLRPVEPGGRDGGEGSAVVRPRKRKKHRMPQQCTVCGRTYTKLAQHMARVHGTGEPCMCTDCGKFLRNATTLRAHVLSRTCHKSRVCPVCERTCENDAGLKSHMRSHAAALGDRDGPPGMKDHHCDECGHAFSSSEALDSHLALHASGKHHICCVCGRTFIHARSLRLHLRMHTGETPFDCKACGKGFRSRKGLSEHQSVHTMEKRYGCTACGRRFRLRRTFARHLVIHSGVKRYTCRECGMRFAFSHLWKRHVRTHAGERLAVIVENSLHSGLG